MSEIDQPITDPAAMEDRGDGDAIRRVSDTEFEDVMRDRFDRTVEDWQDAQQSGRDNLPMWATPFAWWDGML